MKKIIILFIFSCSLCLSKTNPNDFMKKAKEKFYSYEDITIEFEYSLNKSGEVDAFSKNGKIIFRKDLYHAYIGDVEQLYDGKKIYTITKKTKEVNITLDKEENIMTPNKVLSKYAELYSLKMDISHNTPKGKIQFINLTPKKNDAKAKNILIGINTKDFSIDKIIEVSKKGDTATLKITSMATNKNVDSSVFIFDTAKYEKMDYLINDMSF